jgi:hypothetical protein
MEKEEVAEFNRFIRNSCCRISQPQHPAVCKQSHSEKEKPKDHVSIYSSEKEIKNSNAPMWETRGVMVSVFSHSLEKINIRC